MKRWYPYMAALVAVIATLLVLFCVHHARRQRAQRLRELGYENILRSYSGVLKTGMTRKQVEDYLSAKGVRFRQMCCVTVKEFSKGVYDDTYDDLVKIGQEDVPWACSENNVYIAFQFLGSEERAVSGAEPSDTLGKVTIYHWLEGCM
jgi:hypothetical protein